MGVRPLDTSPEAWAIMQAAYRRMTLRQRVERSAALTVLAHSFALAETRTIMSTGCGWLLATSTRRR